MKKSKCSPDRTSAEKVGSNEGILSLIFLYLHAKTLITFKFVCKQWSSLISDPHFARHHAIASIDKNPSPSGFFLFNSFNSKIHSYSLSRKRSKRSLPCRLFLEKELRILQSCNGLFLCCFRSGLLCVCNPTTGNLKELPSAKMDGEFGLISPYTLAFDPLRSPNYKVVCFKRIKKELPESTGSYYYSQILMYSSEKGFWEASACFEVHMCLDMEAGVYSNGAIHWTCHEQFIYFDIKEENVKLMRIPFIHGNHESSWSIGCLWQWHNNVYCVYTSEFFLSLNEFDQTAFKWSRHKYTVIPRRLSNLALNAIMREGAEQGRYNREDSKFCAIAVLKGNKEKDTVILAAIFGKIISYNFARRKIKVILDLGLPAESEGNLCCNCLGAFQYIQTLYPV